MVRVEHCVETLWQGNTNGCGTTSLAMVLNALTISGEPVTQKQLDLKRPFDLFTAPGTLLKLSKEQGYFAKQYNHSNFQEIKRHLDNGHLLIALHNAIGKLGGRGPLHYFVIHGYEDGAETGQERLFIVDPGCKDKNRYELSYQDFCRYWERPKLGLIPIGVHRFIVAVSSKEDLATPQNRLPITIHLANCFHDWVNWYAKSRLRKRWVPKIN